MPSVFRFLLVVGLLGGLVYAGVVSLSRFVQPEPREMVVTIPPAKLSKHRWGRISIAWPAGGAQPTNP